MTNRPSVSGPAASVIRNIGTTVINVFFHGVHVTIITILYKWISNKLTKKVHHVMQKKKDRTLITMTSRSSFVTSVQVVIWMLFEVEILGTVFLPWLQLGLILLSCSQPPLPLRRVVCWARDDVKTTRELRLAIRVFEYLTVEVSPCTIRKKAWLTVWIASGT